MTDTYAILGFTLLNMCIVVITATTYRLSWQGVALVIIIALILTAITLYSKIYSALLKRNVPSAMLSICAICAVIAISAIIFLEFVLYRYNFSAGILMAIVAGLEAYALKDLIGTM